MTNPPSHFAQQCAAALHEAAAALPPTITEQLALSRQQALARAACAPQYRRMAAWTVWLSPHWVAVAGSVALGVVAAWLWLHDPLPADAAMDIALLTGDLPVEVYLTPHFSTKL